MKYTVVMRLCYDYFVVPENEMQQPQDSFTALFHRKFPHGLYNSSSR